MALQALLPADRCPRPSRRDPITQHTPALTPWSFMYKPQALQTGSPSAFLLQRVVLVVWQLVQHRPARLDEDLKASKQTRECTHRKGKLGKFPLIQKQNLCLQWFPGKHGTRSVKIAKFRWKKLHSNEITPICKRFLLKLNNPGRILPVHFTNLQRVLGVIRIQSTVHISQTETEGRYLAGFQFTNSQKLLLL